MDATYHLLHNAVRNGVRHGEVGGAVKLSAEICSGTDVAITVCNLPGENHSKALGLQRNLGRNFLMQDMITPNDMKRLSLGKADSDFQGCSDMRKVVSAIHAEAELIFEESQVLFRLTLPNATSSDAPASPLAAVSTTRPESPTIPEGSESSLRFLYADDQNPPRIQGLKIAKLLNVPLLKPKWATEELRGGATRNEPHCCIWGASHEEVAMPRFEAIATEWENEPSIFILGRLPP
jgi:hypothetical protein